jgi:TonB family protein
MMESQTRLGKPSWAREALNGDARADEQAMDFKFFVTWSYLFAPLGTSKTGDAPVPMNQRVPTLVANLREPQAQKEERDSPGRSRAEEENSSAGPFFSGRTAEFSGESSIATQNLDQLLQSTERQEVDPNFNIAWEMVVPKMVRSTPKALPAESKPPAVASELKKHLPIQLQRLGIGLAITLVGILALLMLHRSSVAPRKVAPAPFASPALRLEVEAEQNGLLNIRWNPASTPVVRAREARLVIVERDQQPKMLALNPEQLRTGHLSFQPLGDRVVFRLEVVDSSGTITRDSVLAQSSSVPVAASAEAPPLTQLVPTAKRATVARAEAKADPSEIAEPRAAQQSRPTREFTPPATSQHNSFDSRAVLPDLPAAELSASPVAPLRIYDPGERAGLNRIAPPPAKASASPAGVEVGGNLQAGKLIKKVAPIYPPMAAATRVQGTVRFKAIIAKDGTIQNLQTVSGPSLLVKAAADAVKQWVYQPTVLNGQPMEVQTQIEVNFNLNK